MHKKNWYLISLFNLAIVALFGSALRSKMLFSVPWIDHKNFINAHSHFAFGGWVSLSLLALFTAILVPENKSGQRWYQAMLGGIQICSLGMLLSFPFQGYGIVSIIFSSLFILFTYGYTWKFVKDVGIRYKNPVYLMAVGALICLVISSAGPFTLAYILASGSSNAILYKDAVYYYLHFQYNGFFTLGVFALLISRLLEQQPNSTDAKKFSMFLVASIVPSFFLTLLWHPGHWITRLLAISGVVLISLVLFYFFRILRLRPGNSFLHPMAKLLCSLVLVSFFIKSVLQAGTVVPDLGNTVFGLRPIIIGFLHLVFLGLVSFYILAEYSELGLLNGMKFLSGFIFAVILQETVLLVQGIGLLMGKSSHYFNWILWVLSILLFVTALGVSISAVRKR